MKKFFITIALMFMSIAALFAQEQFLGKWTTIDDKTKEPAGIVNIYQGEDGLYYGKLVGTFGPDKSKVGTMIVKGMKYEDGKLVDGKIYDPESGWLVGIEDGYWYERFYGYAYDPTNDTLLDMKTGDRYTMEYEPIAADEAAAE